MRDSKPVAMNLEVGRFAVRSLSDSTGIAMLKFWGYTYYAGNSRILKAAATRAHCASEG